MINPKQVKILIVDDEQSIRELLSTRFSIFGFQTLTAANGDEAWTKICADTGIKILVTDLSMPGMNGQELIERCKSANSDAPRIFAVTGEPNWSVETLYAIGAEGILHKPFDARNLLNITRNSLLTFAERLRYPPYVAAAATIQLQFPNLKTAKSKLQIGRGGFFLTSKETMPTPGSVVAFDLSFGEFELQGNGVIRWQRDEQNSDESTVGIEFTYLKPKSIEALQAWLLKNPSQAFIPSPQSVNSMPSTAKLQSTG